MSIINFAIPDTLAQKIEKAINSYGFSSKAEFFRFAAIYFLNFQKEKLSEEEKFELLSKQVSKLLENKFANKKLPPLKDQLSDL
jgi:metal-responsive CopG/Arc/MetJ family transcriptional regulator